MIKIETGVPIPPARGRHASAIERYPFDTLGVDGSFAAPIDSEAEYSRIRQAMHRASKRLGVTFTSRRDGNIIRIWRTV